MSRSAHVDTFAKDHLPPQSQWPDLLLDRPEFRYPERLNCVAAFLDCWADSSRHDAPCLMAPDATLSYAQLQDRVNRLANVLVDRLGLVPGGRVLLRAGNLGGLLPRGHQGGRNRGGNDAVAARQGARLPLA